MIGLFKAVIVRAIHKGLHNLPLPSIEFKQLNLTIILNRRLHFYAVASFSGEKMAQSEMI